MYESSREQAALDRFKSVDALADRIFDRIPELGDEAQGHETLAQQNAQAGDANPSNVVPLFSTPPPDTSFILAKTEKLLGGLLQALEGADQRPNPKTESEDHVEPNFATAPDISYRAAQRRQQLPEGVEILKSAPSKPSDEAIMSSIRTLMDQQEVEFKEMRLAEKRAKAKQILAPLEPQKALEEPVVAQPITRKRVLSKRIIRFLDKGFRNYYFLAISLSGWCTLAMMVLIDPEVAQALGFLSTLLLAAAFCMFGARAEQESPAGARVLA